MIHFALFLLIIAAGFCHAVMDAIKDLRVHLAQHPFRDFWHVMQWFRVAALIGIGYVLPRCWSNRPLACAIVAVFGIVIGRLVWTWTYKQPAFWLFCDEALHLGTGWKWLDKVLGLHW